MRPEIAEVKIRSVVSSGGPRLVAHLDGKFIGPVETAADGTVRIAPIRTVKCDPVSVGIEVCGATGNEEVRRAVAAGVASGTAQVKLEALVERLSREFSAYAASHQALCEQTRQTIRARRQPGEEDHPPKPRDDWAAV